MSIVLLLRFRDLVVPKPGHTITEHQTLADQHGYTWWGWWRKQSEGIPESLWSEIIRQIDQSVEKCATVYLIDSGQRRAYRAKLLHIEFRPGRDGQTAPDDGKMTPAYYQGLEPSAFASWFKLKDIEEASEQDLRGLAYRSVPHDDLLSLPEEKIVGRRVDGVAQLLMFGNVTYWVAEPAAADALDVGPLHIKAPRPITTDPVLTSQSNRILHLSDLHVGGHHAFETQGDPQNPSLAQVVFKAVEKDRPGIVVVTGDLTWMGSDEEFEVAYRCLDDLRSTLGLTHNHFIIVPGNHDLGWIPEDENGGEMPRLFRLANQGARSAYEAFFRKWYGVRPHRDLAVGRRCFLAGGPTVDILGLNSASLQQHEGVFQGLGRIPESIYTDAAHEMGWDGDRATQRRIVLTHHHVVPVVPHERPQDSTRGFGIAIDAGSQLRLAQDFGADFILHGHQHFPFAAAVQTLDFMGDRSPERESVLVLGGGSAGVEDGHVGPFKHRAFNLIEMHYDRTDVHLFATHRSSHFERVSSITAPSGKRWKRPEPGNER